MQKIGVRFVNQMRLSQRCFMTNSVIIHPLLLKTLKGKPLRISRFKLQHSNMGSQPDMHWYARIHVEYYLLCVATTYNEAN